VVEDGVTGELVDGRDPLRYAEAVVRIITDPEKLTRYGRAGRLRYEKLFRVDTMVRSYDEIYRRHLARHPIR
jgi:glycosyltransferase involved in cell wall biosynthesis